MYQARKRVLVLLTCVLSLAAVRVCAAQEPKAESPPSATPQSTSLSVSTMNPTTGPSGAKLRVCLRLEDNSQFLGAAEVSLIPSEGYEVVGTTSEKEGETIFSGLAAGRYTLEAKAPGFLSVRMSTAIEATNHERILYLVMKPRPMKQPKPRRRGRPHQERTLFWGGRERPQAETSISG